MADLNPLALLVATIASFGFGAAWYSPVALLPAWSREAGVSTDGGFDNPARVFGFSFLFTAVSAVALALWLGPDPGVLPAAGIGLLAGSCVAATSMGINYQFAGRSLRMWLIDGGFHTLRFGIMGLVLGLWP